MPSRLPDFRTFGLLVFRTFGLLVFRSFGLWTLHFQLSLRFLNIVMKKILVALPFAFAILLSCNDSGDKGGENAQEKIADSLFKQVMHGHDIGMAKDEALQAAIANTQVAIDSMNRLPVAARLVSINHKHKLDSLLTDLKYADFAMSKWMKEMQWDPSKMEVKERIKYLNDEKIKVDKVSEAILTSLARADTLLKK